MKVYQLVQNYDGETKVYGIYRTMAALVADFATIAGKYLANRNWVEQSDVSGQSHHYTPEEVYSRIGLLTAALISTGAEYGDECWFDGTHWWWDEDEVQELDPKLEKEIVRT